MRSKKTREKGKLRLSRYFQELKPGDKVSIVRELSVKANFPDRMQGKTGIIAGTRGKSYVVNVKEGKKEKKFIVKSVHLKKLK